MKKNKKIFVKIKKGVIINSPNKKQVGYILIMKTVAVIGCGRIANNAHFPALSALEDVRIKYACDLLIEKDSKRITDDIVDQLIAYRKKLKLTQQDIADATGIKRANIARLELKKNEASLDSLVRYAKSMELDLAIELVGMKEVSF